MSTDPRPVPVTTTDGLRHRLVPVLLDALVVVVFAAVGRREHDSGDPLAGVLETAWPFLVGAGVGHLLVGLALRRAHAGLVGGALVWACTVAVGMVLRQVVDQGTAFAFVLVATGFTGALMLGWRILARGLRRG